MEFVSGNIFIRKNAGMTKDDKVGGHTHNFDHTTFVIKGSIHVAALCPDGRVIDQDFCAPTHFLVKAEVKHEITALEDGTEFWCVYSHRTPQGDVIQEHTGWGDAYG